MTDVLLALAKAWVDAIVERETYVHGEGWDVADMGVQRARAAFTSALAAQQAHIATLEGLEAAFKEAGFSDDRSLLDKLKWLIADRDAWQDHARPIRHPRHASSGGMGAG
jgi:hypothetical protein